MFELDERQRELQSRARAFAEAELPVRASQVDETQDYPWDIVSRLTEAGFVGLTIPKDLGGHGLGYLEAVLVIEEMAKKCGVTARIVVETNMGAIGAILAYGSDEQKAIASELVLGGDKPAICMTEPGAGSALTELTSRADRRGNGYVLNGVKHWITGGGVSRLHLIFARVFEDGEEQGIAAFIAIRGEDEGLVIGPREPTMGLRGIPETLVEFRELFLGADRMVVPPEGIRRGFAGLMNAYNGQRTGAATVALGIATGAYELALQYAKDRRQFGRPICEFQGLQWMMADMAIQLDAARLLVHRAAASAPPNGFPDPLLAAQAKIHASETAIATTRSRFMGRRVTRATIRWSAWCAMHACLQSVAEPPSCFGIWWRVEFWAANSHRSATDTLTGATSHGGKLQHEAFTDGMPIPTALCCLSA